METSELIYKRCLIWDDPKGYSSSKRALEIKVLEVSPSGNWIKILNIYGQKYWKPVAEFQLIEVLKDLSTGKPEFPKDRK